MEDDLKLNEWQFSQRKNLPYDVKVRLTEQRIREWYYNWDGKVYVSFSGGLDSTLLLHLVRKVLGKDIPAVFCNTGLEFPEIVQFARSASKNGNYVELKPDMNFKKVIEMYGYPMISKETAAKVRKLRHGKLSPRYRNYLLNGDERGKGYRLALKWHFLLNAPFDISEKCCDVMKKKPFKKYAKETGRLPYIGTTQDESYIRERLYAKNGCNVYDGNTIKSTPIGFWKKQDVLRYVYENNIPFCPVYGEIVKENETYRLTGEQRTGCMFCGFGCHLEKEPNRFQRMGVSHQKQYEFCMKPVNQGGLGLGYVLGFIGIPYETWEQNGQLNLFNNI